MSSPLTSASLKEQGHSVTGVELSPIAVQQFWDASNQTPSVESSGPFERTTADGITLLCGDFFGLTQSEFAGPCAFYDRASIIALRPDLRIRYCAHLARVLPKGSCGLMVTLAYDQSMLDGPPFSVDAEKLESLMADDFMIETLASDDVEIENPRMREAGLPQLTRHVFRLERR